MLKRVLIFAEAGVNHNGSIELAQQLIEAAADAGADYVKFQTFKAELNISKTAVKANYQKQNTQDGLESQLVMVKKLELSFENFAFLNQQCVQKKIGFLSTGFDFPSIDFLNSIGQTFFKIPSGEITNKPYLQHIARIGKPVVMSTGMATMEEIGAAIDVLMKQGLKKEQIVVLHCNTEYPTPMHDVNLKAMLSIREAFGVKVGYSDHTLGIEVPIAAVALGATVIEKHFTLDRNLPGPDHRASLEPNELKQMIHAIRNVELALSGNGKKEPSESERHNIPIARKSIHISKTIEAGTILNSHHLVMKRPGNGISPMDIDVILGKRTLRRLTEDYLLQWEDLES
ncbi:MAG TPA: N-acetylneuraminate synthase [Bacteroidales bacterium]|nr:N-acetylneuraminate synthase [Bacteroidales bacterium]